MKTISIAIYHYSHALKSAIYGLEEMFLLVNEIADSNVEFIPSILSEIPTCQKHYFDIIILPPAMKKIKNTSRSLILWINQQHKNGAIIASSCAGAFILAQTDCLGSRSITTHWYLAHALAKAFPNIVVESEKLLINHGDVLSAGGLMSWIDLGLEIVKTQTSAQIMRQLGKRLVIDTASREQRFYCQFQPNFNHGDSVIVSIQHDIHKQWNHPFSIADLAKKHHLTERTLHRKFSKATLLSPKQYQQRLRIQKACDLLESSKHPIEKIAEMIGYQDTTAFRKQFNEQMGLSPKAFRTRFTTEN